MNSNRVRFGLAALLLSTGMLFVLAANAEDAQAPAPADSAGSSDAGAADADVDGDADAGPPPLPAFDETPFPDEKSPRPKKDEWKTAPEVAFSEGSLSSGGSCKLQRVREWIRINCPMTTAQLTLMCGNAEDVFLELGPVPVDWGTFPEGGEIVFAVRKGDRRLFEWQGVEFGYRGSNSANSFLVISELWLPGDEKPVIVAK
jgi:hypothetical protein